MDGSPITRTSVEAIAAYYLKEIRSVQPHGPYLLGGYSFGGLVSYEIARELRVAGEQVALLALFDTPNPANPPRARSWISLARYRIPRLLSKGITKEHVFEYLAGRFRGKLGAKLLHWNERVHVAGKENDPAKFSDLQIRMVHARASLAYKPRPYPGKITLFRTLDQGVDFEAQPDLGWSSLALGGIAIHDVLGNHSTLFWDTGVQALARKLADSIRSSLANN